MAKILVVDTKDQIIGSKERAAVSSADIYRVSALWLTNSRSEVLLAQRAFTKAHDPGKWGPAVAGTVEEGETYESNIRKEIFEEIGLNELPLKLGPKLNRAASGREHRYFGQWFLAQADIDVQHLRHDPKEVAALRWFSRDEIQEHISRTPGQFLTIICEWVRGEVEFRPSN